MGASLMSERKKVRDDDTISGEKADDNILQDSLEQPEGVKYNCDIDLIEFILDSFICLFPSEQSAPCASCHSRYKQKQHQEQEYGVPPDGTLPKYDHRGRTIHWY